jgi:hypothetical protein
VVGWLGAWLIILFLAQIFYEKTMINWTASVVWWSEFLPTDPEVPGSIPGYQIFWEVVDLERVLIRLMNEIEELLGKNSSGSSRVGSVNPLRWPRDTLYPQTSAPTSQTNGGRSVSIVLSRTKATELV